MRSTLLRTFFGAVLIVPLLAVYAMAADKPILLKLSHHNSPASPMHKEPTETFMANVEKRSDGRIKFAYFPAEQIVRGKGDLEAVRVGVCDIQYAVTSYVPEAYPMTNMYMLPFAHKSAVEGFRSYMNLKGKYIMPETDKLGVKLFSPYLGSSYVLFTVDKPVRKIEDLKGLRVRSPGAAMTKILTKIGAQPISMSAADIYEGLQKRTVDAATHTLGYLGSTVKAQETTKTGYIIDAGGLGTFIVLILMNKNSWEKLNPDLQKIVEEEGINLGFKISRNFDNDDDQGLKVMLDHGVTKIVWDEVEKDKVKKLGVEVWNEEAARWDAKGYPATRLLNEFKQGR